MNDYLALCAEIKAMMESRGAKHEGILDRAQEERIKLLRTAATDKIAEGRGWKRAGKPFTLRQLREGAPIKNNEDRKESIHKLCDHAAYYKNGRKPAGIISHLYGSGGESERQEILALATSLGLCANFLPDSSYYPGETLGVILTPSIL